jgi:Methyltransferase domain
LRVVDLASGKGYLTFAGYSFLKQEGFDPQVIGIERRDALVDLCNGVARECGFDQIRFESGEIAQASLSGADVGIALRACDTTTDDAIYGGIRSGAEIILTAPCCHTELRPQLHPPAHLAPLFKFGIQMDRMAESITDALRSMYLEASGYHTRLQESIFLEHVEKSADHRIEALRWANGRRSLPAGSEFRELFGIETPASGRSLAKAPSRLRTANQPSEDDSKKEKGCNAACFLIFLWRLTVGNLICPKPNITSVMARLLPMPAMRSGWLPACSDFQAPARDSTGNPQNRTKKLFLQGVPLRRLT